MKLNRFILVLLSLIVILILGTCAAPMLPQEIAPTGIPEPAATPTETYLEDLDLLVDLSSEQIVFKGDCTGNEDTADKYYHFNIVVADVWNCIYLAYSETDSALIGVHVNPKLSNGAQGGFTSAARAGTVYANIRYGKGNRNTVLMPVGYLAWDEKSDSLMLQETYDVDCTDLDELIYICQYYDYSSATVNWDIIRDFVSFIRTNEYYGGEPEGPIIFWVTNNNLHFKQSVGNSKIPILFLLQAESYDTAVILEGIATHYGMEPYGEMLALLLENPELSYTTLCDVRECVSDIYPQFFEQHHLDIRRTVLDMHGEDTVITYP